jgi:chromatin assembly factor 1 subunit A
MDEFKKAVEGSELSKIGLIEVLNKQFSKIPKSSIKNTLEAYAVRKGIKEVEKRWVWKEDV